MLTYEENMKDIYFSEEDKKLEKIYDKLEGKETDYFSLAWRLLGEDTLKLNIVKYTLY